MAETITTESLRRELETIRAYKSAGVANWSDARREIEIQRELVRRQITKLEKMR